MRESIASRLRVRWMKGLLYATCNLSLLPLSGLQAEGPEDAALKLKCTPPEPKETFSLSDQPIADLLDPLVFSYLYPYKPFTEYEEALSDLLLPPLSIHGAARAYALRPASLRAFAFLSPNKTSVPYWLDPIIFSYACFCKDMTDSVQKSAVPFKQSLMALKEAKKAQNIVSEPKKAAANIAAIAPAAVVAPVSMSLEAPREPYLPAQPTKPAVPAIPEAPILPSHTNPILPEVVPAVQSRSVDASFARTQKEITPSILIASVDDKKEVKELNPAAAAAQEDAYPLYEKDIKNFLSKALVAQETIGTSPELPSQGHLINFRNAPMSDYIRFVASLTGRNFIYREEDVQFYVTVVSKEPTSIENVVSALLQELRIHGLALFQQDNNFMIYPAVGPLSPAMLLSPDGPNPELGTRIFQMRYVSAYSVASIMTRMLSEQAIVQVVSESNSLLITDFTNNIERASKIIEVIDTLSAAYNMGQYIATNNRIEELIPLAEKILEPLSGGGTPPIFVVQSSTNSAYVIGSSDLVNQAFAVLDRLDGKDNTTEIFDHSTLIRLGAHRRPSQVAPAGGGRGLAPIGGVSTGVQEGQRAATEAQAAPAGTLGGTGAGGGFQEAGASGRARERPLDIERAFDESLQHEGDVLTNTPEGDTVARGTLWEPYATAAERASQKATAAARQRTKFYIYKLDYRRGDQLVAALLSIAESLSYDETQNRLLLDAINSVQWIEASNSIIITGTYEAIIKVKDLIQELDTPLKQVYLEMLVLDTTLADSISFSVDSLDRLNGERLAFAQGFVSNINGSAFTTVNPTVANIATNVDASPLASIQGYNLGIIGRHIFHCSTSFSSLAALVRALHTDTTIKVVINPKIVVEDNFPAAIFVGQNTAFQTQSIANNNGNIITNNVEYRDVGTSLKVTPQIGNGNIITLTIDQEVSAIVSTTAGTNTVGNQTAIPVAVTTNKATTVTKVHVPDGYFVLLSGMLRDEKQFSRSQLPCVGGIPFLGAAFSGKNDTIAKRNYIIFIRPKIVEGDVYVEETRRNQDIWDAKEKQRPRWKYEADEALDYLNLPRFNEPNDWNCSPLGSLGPCASCSPCQSCGSSSASQCASCGSCGCCADCGFCGCCECN